MNSCHTLLNELKASPIRQADDISPDLYPKLDILVVNEYEAPILLGWATSSPDKFPLRNLQHAMLAAKTLQTLKDVPTVVILAPFGHVCRITKAGKVCGARFQTFFYTRGCHWIPRMFA
jgi:hypothetical protein